MSEPTTGLGDLHKKQSLARYIINGFIMGLGELLPGVGTQTVAILLGIYDECMSAGYSFADFGGIVTLFIIGRAPFAKVKTAFWHVPWKFFITLGVMSVLTFLILSGILNDIFVTYP